MCVIDEYTRECLAIEVGTSLRLQDVILTLSRLMRLYGKPTFVRSDHGAEFTATKVMRWLRTLRSAQCSLHREDPGKTALSKASTANCAMNNREWFRNRAEGKVLIERWRQFYNQQRPHSAHRYKTSASIRHNWLNSDNITTQLTA